MTSVVIVGGGIGGVATAAALRSGGFDGDVTLVDPADFPYDRPPLSKDYLAGTKSLTDLALQPADWYTTNSVRLEPNTTVTSIAPTDDHVTVELDDGRTLSADHVVLATGGHAMRPPIPGAESERVHVLREAADADALRAALAPGARLLVVGAGLIGAETASTAKKLGCEVVIVDPVQHPIGAAVGNEVAAYLHGEHPAHEVEAITTTLQSLHETDTGIVAHLTHAAQTEREFDVVLLGVGMSPAIELAQGSDLRLDRGVLVDENQRTSHPRVFAVGDVSRLEGHDRAEHWEAAQHDAARAAAAIIGAARPADSTRWFWSDRYDRHVEGVGEMHEPDAEHTVVVRGSIGAEPFAVFTLRDSKVIGAVAVDDSQAVRAARRLIDRGIPVDADQLGDPATDLRSLLRRAR